MITQRIKKKELALLIPAHNEELVLYQTLVSALNAGFAREDVYVISDGSTDNTVNIGQSLLGKNCINIKNVGKGNALKTGLQLFDLLERYQWISMTDADTMIDKTGYSAILASVKRNHNFMAICGQVKTIKSTWISHYRAYEYAIGHDFYKNIESLFSLILITPGCCTTYNANLFKILDIEGTHVNDTFVEDYDLTMEIHHKLKEKIIYDPSIVFWTQEPDTLKVYINQSLRWHRGWYQVAKKRLRFPIKKIDLLIYYFTIDPLVYVLEVLAIFYLAFLTKNAGSLGYIVLSDCIVLLTFAAYAAFAKKRFEILGIFPLIFFIRYLNMALFFKAGFEVIFMKKFPLKTTTWNTPRYLNT